MHGIPVEMMQELRSLATSMTSMYIQAVNV
jgi:hypothetical protein